VQDRSGEIDALKLKPHRLERCNPCSSSAPPAAISTLLELAILSGLHQPARDLTSWPNSST
jgi:hypothetical protein